jgi:Amt family ammonium transporter
MVWMFLGWLDSKDEQGNRHPSLVESLNGVVAGLAGVTPASGFIHSQAGFCLGIVLGFFSYYGVVIIKGKLKIDDALDVSSVHGITGIVGSLSLGFLASSKVNPAILDGWFYGGDGTMMAYQLIGVAVAGAWAGVWTLVICVGLEKTIGFRVTRDQEAAGLDATLHGETARILDASPQNQLMSPSQGPTKSAPVDDLSLDAGETKPLADGANKV